MGVKLFANGRRYPMSPVSLSQLLVEESFRAQADVIRCLIIFAAAPLRLGEVTLRRALSFLLHSGLFESEPALAISEMNIIRLYFYLR